MRVGQPKLCGLLIGDWNTNSIGQTEISEKNSQRSELFVTPICKVN
jgi:hypothetical protein